MSNEAAIIDWSETRRMAADMISKAEEILRLCAAHAPAKASYSPRLKLVRSVVAAHYGLTSDAILKADRRAPVAWARSTAMFLCRELIPDCDGREIEREFKRTHGCLDNSVQVVAARCQTDARARADISELRQLISRNELFKS